MVEQFLRMCEALGLIPSKKKSDYISIDFPINKQGYQIFNCVSPRRFLIFNRIIQEQEFLAFPQSFISIISKAFRFQRTVWVLITRF